MTGLRFSDNDLRVLEYLHRYRNPRDPQEIAAGAPVNVDWVRHRLPKLRDAGYVEQVALGRGTSPSTWTLTDQGREYLDVNPTSRMLTSET